MEKEIKTTSSIGFFSPACFEDLKVKVEPIQSIVINTKKITLTNNLLAIDVTLDSEKIKNFNQIIINGIRFKKEE